ncbi:MAG: hypothetical protein LBB66_04365 [Desulfovibrio sp.]|jgi:hypothetical protein|nr:hypothetical protein [Desulfovibrio sp.]
MDILVPSQFFSGICEKNYPHFAYKAYENNSLGRVALIVYQRLFSLAADTGTVTLARRKLAEDVCLSLHTLRKAVVALVRLGYIHVETTTDGSGTYTLLIPNNATASAGA